MLTRSQLQSTAKTALEASPLFTGGRVPVITAYVAPGERATEREAAIRSKGACLEISPVLRQKLVAYKPPSLVATDCTISVAVRILPTTLPGDPVLNLDTAVDAVITAMLGLGFTAAVSFDGFKPDDELALLVEDVDGLLSTAVFFTARTHLSA